MGLRSGASNVCGGGVRGPLNRKRGCREKKAIVGGSIAIVKWVLHIIFITPMIVNDVNISFVLRRINGQNP
jgi:hypothetical protein